MSTISIRLNTEDKTMFEDFCNSVGMNVSTAVSMFVKNVIQNQKLPFPVERDPFYSEKNMKYLHESIKQLESGKGAYHDLIED